MHKIWQTNNWFKRIFNPFILLLFAAFLIPLFYAFYTGHIWEDYYITYKFSKNLVEGNGLVYTPGERVHGFTSPLGVLLPALTFFISGSDKAAIWLFRLLFAIPAFIGAVYMLFKISEKLFAEYPPLAYFCPLLLVIDVKSVMFSVNGMETALMLFFCAWTLKIVLCEEWDWKKLGLSWAGLMWTRPDSCIYIASFVVSSLIFLPYLRKSQMKIFIKSAFLCAILYLPWFIFVWSYYGSPVPHTIMAKRVLLSMARGSILQEILSVLLVFRRVPAMVFYPVYPQFAYWPEIVFIFSIFLAYLAIFAVIAPHRLPFSAKIRFLSFYFILICLYFSYLRIPYPWYFPPSLLPALLVICAILIELSRRWCLDKFVISFMLVALVLCFAALFLLESIRMKAQQEIVEEGNRKKIGLWLKEHSEEEDRVFLECLGYIGYFSGRKILDFPGLVSPEVVRVAAGTKNPFVEVVEKLAPEWVVVREFEARKLLQNSFFRTNYVPAEEFNVREKVFEQKKIYGINYLYYDSFFIVYKKKKNN